MPFAGALPAACTELPAGSLAFLGTTGPALRQRDGRPRGDSVGNAAASWSAASKHTVKRPGWYPGPSSIPPQSRIMLLSRWRARASNTSSGVKSSVFEEVDVRVSNIKSIGGRYPRVRKSPSWWELNPLPASANAAGQLAAGQISPDHSAVVGSSSECSGRRERALSRRWTLGSAWMRGLSRMTAATKRAQVREVGADEKGPNPGWREADQDSSFAEL